MLHTISMLNTCCFIYIFEVYCIFALTGSKELSVQFDQLKNEHPRESVNVGPKRSQPLYFPFICSESRLDHK
ncbi:hypothetical protein RJT34_24412 [Clitoria ternatea]|uniref:Uncharacterized protein n=1 Tax=Clitoria ternatea TaxID=43366 RepID=A0AAN9FWC6_CLITE